MCWIISKNLRPVTSKNQKPAFAKASTFAKATVD